MNEREELSALRRMAELEAKAGVASPVGNISENAQKVSNAKDTMKQYGAAVVGAADLASFGLGDEMIAGLKSWPAYLTNKLDFKDVYSQNLEKGRADIQQTQEENPNAFLAGQVGGALLTGGIGAGTKFANSLRTGGIIPRAAKASALGAALGGATGFGAGSGFEDRLASAGDSALASGLVGGAIPVVGAGAGKVINAAAPAAQRVGAIFGNQGAQESIADRIIASRLLQEGFTPEQVMQKVAQARASGLNPTLGESLNSSGILQAEKSIVRGTGKGANEMRNALFQRSRDVVPNRLNSFASKLEENAGDLNALKQASVEEAAQNIAKQNLKTQYSVTGMTPQGLPIVKESAQLPNEAAKIINEIEKNVNNRLSRLGSVNNVETASLNQAKAIIDTAKANGGGFDALLDAKRQLDNMYVPNADSTVQKMARGHVSEYRKTINEALNKFAPNTFKEYNKSAMAKMAATDIKEALQSTNEGSLGVLYNKVWAKPELRNDFLRKLPDDATRQEATNLFTQLENVKRGFGGSDTAFNLPANQQLSKEAGLGFNPTSLNPFETAPKFMQWVASKVEPGVYNKLAEQSLNPNSQRIVSAMIKSSGGNLERALRRSGKTLEEFQALSPDKQAFYLGVKK